MLSKIRFLKDRKRPVFIVVPDHADIFVMNFKTNNFEKVNYSIGGYIATILSLIKGG